MEHQPSAPGLLPNGRTADGRYTITSDELGAILGLGRSATQELLRSGKVRRLQFTANGAVRIPVTAVLQLLGGLPDSRMEEGR